ncbi:MAG: ATP-binding cassette domain-containing protein [Ruminococcaceae bacterium]|nr:ATP-binding cassette domain-containing protein [Oscillospiraceae bacterium]
MLHAAKKKEPMRTPTELAHMYDEQLNTEQVLFSFFYNRSVDEGGYDRAEGVVCLLEDRLLAYDEGSRCEYPLVLLKSARMEKTPGGVQICLVTKSGEEHALCASDRSAAGAFADAAARIRAQIEGEAYEAHEHKKMGGVCPKCHRPLAPGASVCPRCRSKKDLLAGILSIIKPFRLTLAFSILLFIAGSLLQLITPYVSRVLVDDYIRADKKPALVAFASVVLTVFLVGLLSKLLGILRGLLTIHMGEGVIVKLRGQIFDKINRLSLGCIRRRTTGELMQRVNSDTEVIRDFITREMATVIEQILILASVTVLLFLYDWKLALLVLVPAPLVMLLYMVFHRYIRRMYHRQWKMNARANTVLHDIFSGMRVVKTYGTEKKEIARYDEAIDAERRIQIRNEVFFGKIQPILSFLMGIGQYLLLFYAGKMILDGKGMTYGELTQFTAYVTMVYGPLRYMTTLPRRLVRTATAFSNILELLEDQDVMEDRTDTEEMEIEGNIEIRDLTFAYEEDKEVLRNVNLDIRTGEMIGLVGRSGVGKTTLINLIMHMYESDKGVIRIDGRDVREIPKESLRKGIGAVLQETYLFSGSIYDNIAYAKPNATKEEVIAAAMTARAHEFIVKMPDGYNSYVGEKGCTLSGGERQRIAIARALLRDPKILILDEATSALDTETEAQVQEALAELIKGRTVIAIAHRLSTLRNATRIVVLDRGTVAEQGTHDELMRQNGIYYGLVMAQRQMNKRKD